MGKERGQGGAIDRATLAAQRMHRVLSGLDPYERADVLIAFVEQLSETDAETLRRHLTPASATVRNRRPRHRHSAQPRMDGS